MDRVEELLVPRQGGIARRRDVLRAGASRRRLARLVREGRLRMLTPHLVTNVALPSPDEPLRTVATALGATVSHTSAALLWGIELATTPERQQVTVPRHRSRGSMKGTDVHRRDLSADDRVERDGLRVTSPLRTVLDLCRSLPLHEAVAAADSALRHALVTVEALTSALVALPAGPGRTRVARVLRLIDPDSGSVLESLCRVLLHGAGLPPEQTQLVIRTRSGRWIGRDDVAWPSAGPVVEVDGFAFHAGRDSYCRDRRRGNALVLAGWRVLRFSWEDVVHSPDEVVAAVREALAERTLLHTA
jgi:very-short-patch-repair endonuclease